MCREKPTQTCSHESVVKWSAVNEQQQRHKTWQVILLRGKILHVRTQPLISGVKVKSMSLTCSMLRHPLYCSRHSSQCYWHLCVCVCRVSASWPSTQKTLLPGLLRGCRTCCPSREGWSLWVDPSAAGLILRCCCTSIQYTDNNIRATELVENKYVESRAIAIIYCYN